MVQRPRRNSDDFLHPAMTYKKPASLRRFQKGMVLTVSFLVVVGLWTGGWFAAQAWVKSSLSDWVTNMRAQGVTVRYESLRLSGFPTRIKLDIIAPKFNGPMFGKAFGQNIAWKGERLTINTRPWMPWKLHVEGSGIHELAFPAWNMNLKGTVQNLNADLVSGQSWPESLDISLSGLKLQDLTTGANIRTGASWASLRHDMDKDNLQVSFRAQSLYLPRVINLPLGNQIDLLDFDLILNGVLSPDDLTNNLGQAVVRWKNRKGNIDVKHLKFKNGPFTLTTSGALSLDENLQIVGDFTAKMSGLFKVLEILRLKGLIKPTDAVIATMALSAFSKRPKDGGPATINLSVTADHQKLNLGPIEILSLPQLTWGIAPPSKPAPKPPRNYKNAPAVY